MARKVLFGRLQTEDSSKQEDSSHDSSTLSKLLSLSYPLTSLGYRPLPGALSLRHRRCTQHSRSHLLSPGRQSVSQHKAHFLCRITEDEEEQTSAAESEGQSSCLPGEEASPRDPQIQTPTPAKESNILGWLVRQLVVYVMRSVAATAFSLVFKTGKFKVPRKASKGGRGFSSKWAISLGLYYLYNWAGNAWRKRRVVEDETAAFDAGYTKTSAYRRLKALIWGIRVLIAVSRGTLDFLALPRLWDKAPTAPVSGCLYKLNILVYAADTLSSRQLFAAGYNQWSKVMSGQVWRIFTSAFLHDSLHHLESNIAVFRGCGLVSEFLLGKEDYLKLYFVSIVGSSVVSLLIPGDLGGVGASGATFGIMGGILAVRDTDGVHFPTPLKDYIAGVAECAVSELEDLPNPWENVGVAAHAVGFLSGWVFVLMHNHKLKRLWDQEGGSNICFHVEGE